jgi:hypothetical protein
MFCNSDVERNRFTLGIYDGIALGILRRLGQQSLKIVLYTLRNTKVLV